MPPSLCSSVPLNQWFNLRATLSQWLLEQRTRVYADLVDSVDNLVSVVFLLANAPIAHQIVEGDDMQRYKVASANFRRACSVAEAYCISSSSMADGSCPVIQSQARKKLESSFVDR